MAIDQFAVQDAVIALSLVDDVRSAYYQLKGMQTKIQRYAAGVQAVAEQTADAREARFVNLVQILANPTDLQRIGALLPSIGAIVADLETNYDDFIHPQ